MLTLRKSGPDEELRKMQEVLKAADVKENLFGLKSLF